MDLFLTTEDTASADSYVILSGEYHPPVTGPLGADPNEFLLMDALIYAAGADLKTYYFFSWRLPVQIQILNYLSMTYACLLV